MMGTVQVLHPGLLTSVQDAGRRGFQHLGFGVSGAADERCLALANHLVGNPIGAAVLEATVRGPRVRFGISCQIAVVGCQPAASLNGRPVSCNQTLGVQAGDVVEVSRTGGARAYVAISGGILVTSLLGSSSTDLIAGVGGYAGRALRVGDELPITATEPIHARKLRPHWVPKKARRLRVRCVRGPQADLVKRESLRTLLASRYVMRPESDRMGIRLEGPRIPPPPEILSEGQPAGSVQILPSGQLIILMPGRQTVGGYAKVAVVGRKDLSGLSQLLPGAEIAFQMISLDASLSITRPWLNGLADVVATTAPGLT